MPAATEREDVLRFTLNKQHLTDDAVVVYHSKTFTLFLTEQYWKFQQCIRVLVATE